MYSQLNKSLNFQNNLRLRDSRNNCQKLTISNLIATVVSPI